LDQLAAQNRLVGYAFEGQRYDAGDRLGYLKANIAYGLKRPDLKAGLMEHMRQIVRAG
jgi:UTP--glucose-1-phosphate uridylyltransferase